MEHVNVGGRRIGFQRRGQGPVLLLLHGAVCDSRVWRVELESFADAFTVVAWDTPGCGASDDPPEEYRMADFADGLAGFLGAIGVEQAHVLGRSWGSTLALELCLRRPAMVRSLVLVGAYAGWAGSLPASEVQRRLEFALTSAEMDPNPFQPTSMPGLFTDAMPTEQAEELARIMSEIRPAATRTMAHALAESDLRAALPNISAPTLLVCGENDARSPLTVAEDLHRSIPESTLSVLPGLGHECHLEAPKVFEATVRSFLQAQG